MFVNKIATITMYGDNYGACLQAFALQQIIKQNGYDNEIINYHQHNRTQSGGVSKLKKVKQFGIKKTILYFLERKYAEVTKRAFQDFRDNHLVFSNREYYRDDNLTELNSVYDKFICGSDMIWSEEFKDDWNFYYLGFAERNKTYAYAPSFGKNELEDINKEKVSNYLNDFNKISCRENGGVALIRQLTDKKAVQVLDPTMLLTMNEWNSFIDNNQRIIEEPYVFAYVFGETDSKRKKLFDAVQSEIAQVRFLPKNNKRDFNNFPIKGVGPFDYLRLFRDAEFVITDTFHGLMFSIIFRKPFIVLERSDGTNWSKYSDRMTSTLEMFNLLDRYVNADFRDIRAVKTMDYSACEAIIQSKREQSLDYINGILRNE